MNLKQFLIFALLTRIESKSSCGSASDGVLNFMTFSVVSDLILWDRSERREILRSKISLTSLMGHMPGWLARCLRQSEFDVSQILTVLGGGCP